MKTMMEDPPTRIINIGEEGYIVVPPPSPTRWERFAAWVKAIRWA